MTVVQLNNKGAYDVAEKVLTEFRARTMTFNPTTGTAYLPIAQFGPTPNTTTEGIKPGPAILPDSFELLVVRATP